MEADHNANEVNEYSRQVGEPAREPDSDWERPDGIADTASHLGSSID